MHAELPSEKRACDPERFAENADLPCLTQFVLCERNPVRHTEVRKTQNTEKRIISNQIAISSRFADRFCVAIRSTEREKEIGRRLRAFRDGLGIFRTAFAVSVGIGSDRLASYETGRVPLRYDIFKAINSRYHLSAHWLVAEKGTPRWDRPFDDSILTEKPHHRELLSSAYDRLLAAEYERLEIEAKSKVFGPTGFVKVMENFLAATSDPELRKTIPPDVIEKILMHCSDMIATLGEAIGEERRISKGLKRKKPKRRGSG